MRFLVVEDSEDDALLLVRELRRSGFVFEWERVQTRQEMQEALEKSNWDLILSDYALPGFIGSEALALCKFHRQDIPFIVVSGAIGEQTAVSMMKAGAHDYLMKGYLARLGEAVRRELAEAQMRRERRQAEQSLRESEKRYRRIVETSSEGIWAVNENFVTTFANRRMAEILGYTVEDLIGHTFLDFMLNEDKSSYAGHMKIGEQGISERFELRLQHSNGKPVWCLVSTTPIMDESKRFQGSFAMLNDITERKLTEQSLLESEERFRTIVELSPDATFIADLNGQFIEVNEAACRQFGYERPELLRKNMFDIVHPDFIEQTWKRIRQMQFEVGYYDSRYIRKDGGKVMVELGIRRITFQGIPALLGVARDITERILGEEKLAQAATDLTQAYDSTLEGWALALELREEYTAGHSRRVVDLTLTLARKLGVDDTALSHIRRGALLHDIGKMPLADSILMNKGPLSQQEWDIMRQHPAYARKLMEQIPYLQPAIDIPYCHHEKWDGSGYPQKLQGEEIPLAARIFAVADVWDALTNDRLYRPAWTPAAALEYIQSQSGSHFDPRVVEVFIETIQYRNSPQSPQII